MILSNLKKMLASPEFHQINNVVRPLVLILLTFVSLDFSLIFNFHHFFGRLRQFFETAMT